MDAAILAVEFHKAVFECEEGVIASDADVVSGVETCSTLAEDDVSGNDGLTAKFFNAKTFGDAIASVLGATLTFFVCHKKSEVGGWLEIYKFRR